MSLPYTIYEAKLVQCDDRRERSLAAHSQLMHLPQVDSLLKRLMERLRAATYSAFETRERPPAAGTGRAKHPPALSN
jgi:hypothetical protein